MTTTKQNATYVTRYVSIVALVFASGCASYPAQPPTCSGEYYPINPSHMNSARGDSQAVQEAAPTAAQATAINTTANKAAYEPPKQPVQAQTAETVHTAPVRPVAIANEPVVAKPTPKTTKIARGFDLYYRGQSDDQVQHALSLLKKEGYSDLFRSGRNQDVIYLGRFQSKDIAQQRVSSIEQTTGLDIGVMPFGQPAAGESNE